MKKIIITLFTMTVLFTGCSKEQPPKSIISQLLSYQDSYVGDAGAVSHIIGLLPGNKFTLNGISLQTTNEPYGITVEYIKNEENEDAFTKLWTEETTKKVLLNNATVLFSLVQNVGEVHFIVDGNEHTFTRSEIEAFYGKDAAQLIKTAKPANDANYYFEKNYEEFYK